MARGKKKGLPNPRFRQKERGGPGKESRESSSSDLDGERKEGRGDRRPKWTRKEFSALGWIEIGEEERKGLRPYNADF